MLCLNPQVCKLLLKKILYLFFICVNNNLKFYQISPSILAALVTSGFLLFLKITDQYLFACETKALPSAC